MKAYYNQEKIASSFRKILKKVGKITKPQLKTISYMIPGMISAESIVTADISRKLKDNFSEIDLESIERKFRRFFKSFSTSAYEYYENLIKEVMKKFTVKHEDKKIYIAFDHMFCRDRYTILLFSLRIGKQGIPLWFRCFEGKLCAEACKVSYIKEGIDFCVELFSGREYHIIFLGDRWFGSVEILEEIELKNSYYCIRTKSYFAYTYYNKKGFERESHLKNIGAQKRNAKVLKDVMYTRKKFKTTIVVSKYSKVEEPWYLVTNDAGNRAVRNYSYRFGTIEAIFKSQKSNGFRLESTKIKKLEHFKSMFTVMNIGLLWLTIIGCDYTKNKHKYHLKIRDVRRHKDNTRSRQYSFFNLGLTIFNRCYYNTVRFRLKFDFVLYDI